MPRFVGRVIVEQVGAYWITRAALVYVDSVILSEPTTIPEMLVSDFASTPRLLWWWAPPTEHTYAAAALLHDFAYERHFVTRRVADALLYEASRATGTRRTKACLMWCAVRLFGCAAYRSGPARQQARLAVYAVQNALGEESAV